MQGEEHMLAAASGHCSDEHLQHKHSFAQSCAQLRKHYTGCQWNAVINSCS